MAIRFHGKLPVGVYAAQRLNSLTLAPQLACALPVRGFPHSAPLRALIPGGFTQEWSSYLHPPLILPATAGIFLQEGRHLVHLGLDRHRTGPVKTNLQLLGWESGLLGYKTAMLWCAGPLLGANLGLQILLTGVRFETLRTGNNSLV